MTIRRITALNSSQRRRLDQARAAIEDEELVLDVGGLHASLDQFIGDVECPFEGWRTADLSLIAAFVFQRPPKLKFTAEQIAAEYALRRDRSYGL